MPRGSRRAEAELGAKDRKLRADLRRAEQQWKRFGKRARDDLKRQFKGIGRDLERSLTIAGGAAFALEGRAVLQFEDKLNRLQIQANASGDTIRRFRGDVDKLSADTGISRNTLIEAAEALVDLEGTAGFSAAKLSVLARANLATGAAMDELAGLSFALSNAFKVTDPAELERGLSAIIQAGKDGAVPLNQMATLLQKLSADFAKIGGTGVDGAADLAAALQVVRRGFGSADEAATGLNSFLTALAKNADRLQKAGVKVFEKDPATGAKRFRDLRSILDDIGESKLIKDPSKLIKALGRDEARKAFDALRDNREIFEDLAAAARASNAVQEDSEKRRQSNAFKIQKAFNNIRLAIASAFTPERIEAFAKMMERIAGFVGGLVDRGPQLIALWAAFKVAPMLGALLDIARAGGAAKILDPGGATGKLQFKSQGLLTLAALSGIAISEILEAAGENAVNDASARADFATFREHAAGGDTGAFVASEARRAGIADLSTGKLDFAAALAQGAGGGARGAAAATRGEGALGSIRAGLLGGAGDEASGRALQLLASSIIAQAKEQRVRVVVELDDGLLERREQRKVGRTP